MHDNEAFNVHTGEYQTDISNHENNINNMLNDLNDANAKPVIMRAEFEYNPSNEMVTILKQQLECLDGIKSFVDEKKELENNTEDWKKLAQVVDRIFMVLFFCFQCSTSLFILLKISTTDMPLHIEWCNQTYSQIEWWSQDYWQYNDEAKPTDN